MPDHEESSSSVLFEEFRERFLLFIKDARAWTPNQSPVYIMDGLRSGTPVVPGDVVADCIRKDLLQHYTWNQVVPTRYLVENGPGWRKSMWVARAAAALTFVPTTEDSKIAALLARKRVDYGADNITSFGENGIIIRCYDKTERIRNIRARAGVSAVGESEYDAWVDIVGYCGVAYLFLDGRWASPPSSSSTNTRGPIP